MTYILVLIGFICMMYVVQKTFRLADYWAFRATALTAGVLFGGLAIYVGLAIFDGPSKRIELLPEPVKTSQTEISPICVGDQPASSGCRTNEDISRFYEEGKPQTWQNVKK